MPVKTRQITATDTAGKQVVIVVTISQTDVTTISSTEREYEDDLPVFSLVNGTKLNKISNDQFQNILNNEVYTIAK